MRAMATAVERGSAKGAQATRRAEAPEPATKRERVAAWGYLVHPALMPTVFTPSGNAPEPQAREEVAARKV